MTRKAIQDEFTGIKSPLWRFIQRRIKAGMCTRCGSEVEDKRYSKIEGRMVKMHTHRICQERQVKNKLYPESEVKPEITTPKISDLDVIKFTKGNEFKPGELK